MKSLKFPKMFNINTTNVTASSEFDMATRQNIILLLESCRGSLLGDPYFGNALQQYLFEQNDYVLKDIVIDLIYNQIVNFLPQVKVERRDIDIIQDAVRGKLICKFTGISQIDYKVYTYSLNLLRNSTI
jgi:phage baseplate assembly protein W